MEKEYEQGDYQRIFLKALVSVGGQSNFKQIKKITNLKSSTITRSAEHLQNRGLIKVKIEKKMINNLPCKVGYYEMNKSAQPKIKRLISELE